MIITAVRVIDGWIEARIDDWAVQSQQVARRNAMIASTALTQRRAELDEVEDFLASLGAASTQGVAPPVAAHG